MGARMRPRATGSVLKHGSMWATRLLAIPIVLVGLVVVGVGDHPLPRPQVSPAPKIAPPPSEMTQRELDALLEHAVIIRPRPLVVAGRHIDLPSDGLVDGLVGRGQPNQVVLDELARITRERGLAGTALAERYAIKQFPSTYMVVRDGEVAMVSKTTGEFQIGEGHEDTFQFLIDQLGQDNMRLIYEEVYEMRWRPFREDYERRGE